MDVYYSIVPDKNYFVASEHGYPSIDYDELCNMMEEGADPVEFTGNQATFEMKPYEIKTLKVTF